MFNLGQFAGRYVEDAPKDMPAGLRTSDRWILAVYSDTVKTVTDCFENYQFDRAMREVEGFIWHEFADNYVEMIKGRTDDAVRYTVSTVLLGALKLLAPFMPHVTEEVYQTLFMETVGVKSIHLTAWPEPVLDDETTKETGEALKDVLAAIRSWKSDKKMALNAPLALVELVGADAAKLEPAKDDIAETVKASEVRIAPEAKLTEEVVGVKPVHAKLGPAFKAQAKAIVAAIGAMDPKAVELDVGGEKVSLGAEFLELEKNLMLDGRAVETLQVGNVLVVIEQ